MATDTTPSDAAMRCASAYIPAKAKTRDALVLELATLIDDVTGLKDLIATVQSAVDAGAIDEIHLSLIRSALAREAIEAREKRGER